MVSLVTLCQPKNLSILDNLYSIIIGGYNKMYNNNLSADVNQELIDLEIDPLGYYYAIKRGCNHSQILFAAGAGLSVWEYSWIRGTGASHKEALEAHIAGVEAWEYVINTNNVA